MMSVPDGGYILRSVSQVDPQATSRVAVVRVVDREQSPGIHVGGPSVRALYEHAGSPWASPGTRSRCQPVDDVVERCARCGESAGGEADCFSVSQVEPRQSHEHRGLHQVDRGLHLGVV
jgi:hypothetical protein